MQLRRAALHTLLATTVYSSQRHRTACLATKMQERLFVRGKSAACHHAAVVLQPVYQPQTLNNQLITHDHTYDIFSLPTLMVVIS